MFEKLKAISHTISPAYFGVSMGLGGLASAWMLAASLYPDAAIVAHALFMLTAIVGSIVTLAYAAKATFHFQLAVGDFCDSNIANFFPGFTFFLLLLASWLDQQSFGSQHTIVEFCSDTAYRAGPLCFADLDCPQC